MLLPGGLRRLRGSLLGPNVIWGLTWCERGAWLTPSYLLSAVFKEAELAGLANGICARSTIEPA